MKKKIFRSFLVLSWFTTEANSVPNEDTVKLQTNGSTIFGKKLFTVYEKVPYAAFYGIAYAELPLEKLRFKPPKGPEILLTSITYDFSQQFNVTCELGTTDNCLRLSVYMPVSINEEHSFPVAVWVHENSNAYEPDFFIEEEILVVTVTFRTLILGFLNTEDEFAKGNMGAKDVLMALRWIRHNIYLFNGDLNKVTVIGSGIGADIAASFLVSIAADDLFSRVIIQSGSALSTMNYRTYTLQVLNKLHKRLVNPVEKFDRNNLYDHLKSLSLKNIISVSNDIFDSSEIRDSQRLTNAFGCSVETIKKGSFIYNHPLEVYKKKQANYNVDVMFGFTNLHALYKLKDFINNRKLLKYLTHNFQYLLPFFERADAFNSEQYKMIQRMIMNFYFINGTMTERSLRRYVKYHSDQVIYPLIRQARLQCDGSRGNIFLYRFLYNGCFNINWKTFPKLIWNGATSGDDICYQFKCKSISDEYDKPNAVKEKLFIKKIAKLWANFIKHGHPTPKTLTNSVLGKLNWKPLRNNKTLEVLNLGKTLKITSLPELKRIHFWDKLRRDFFVDEF